MSGRRSSRFLAVGLAAALLVAACGSSDDAAGNDDAKGTGAAEAFPVTLEHKYGSTTVEAEPERIVVVGLTEQDALLALGVVPVATTEWFGEHAGAIWPWAADEMDALGAEPPALLGDATAVNFEKVAAQDPDLILAVYSGLTDDDYEKLSQIAPTVAQPEEYVDFGVPWDEATRTVGAAIGKTAEAEALVEAVEGQVAAVAAAHLEFAGATSVMATPYEGTYVYGPEDARGRFLTALGFVLPDGLAEVTGEEFGGNLSAERIDLVDVDALIWLDVPVGERESGGEVYNNLRVHREAREVYLDSFGSVLGGATSFITVLSLPFLLEHLVPMLVTAIDGDPATVVPEAVS